MSLEKQGQSRKASDGIQEEPCKICRALKEFQSDYVDMLGRRMPRSLCNFHTWLVAKVAEAGVAAEVLLRMLEHALKDDSSGADCSLCAWIVQEEDRELGEFAQDLNKPEYLQRLRERGGLCIPHARKLFDLVPNGLRDEITLALQRQATGTETRTGNAIPQRQGRHNNPCRSFGTGGRILGRQSRVGY